MNKFKKLLTGLLAATMVLGSSVTTFAADANVSTETGTITIEPANYGQKYNAYRLLDVASYDNGKNENKSDDTAVYKINTEYKEFFDQDSVKEFMTYDDTTGYVTMAEGRMQTEADAKLFAELAQNYVANKTPDATATTDARPDGVDEKATTSIVLKNGDSDKLPLGYYLVIATTGSVLSIDTSHPNATIKDKMSVPTVDKRVYEPSKNVNGAKVPASANDITDYSNDVNLGDTVYFKIVVNCEAGVTDYVVKDKMDAGLTFNGAEDITSVTVGETSVTDYVLNEDVEDCTFELSIPNKYVEKATNTTKITVLYKATVNEKAVVESTGNKNEAWIKYGENGESKHTKTTTYVYSFNIFKESNGDENAPLEGVKFIVADSTKTKFATFSETITAEGYTKVENAKAYQFTGWVEDEKKASSIVTPANGTIQLVGFDADNQEAPATSLYVKETETLDGYKLIDGWFKVTLKGATIYAEKEGTVGSAVVTTDNTELADAFKQMVTSKNNTVTVNNTNGAILPSTGGVGTTVFYVVGAVLILAAVAAFIMKRRASANI